MGFNKKLKNRCHYSSMLESHSPRQKKGEGKKKGGGGAKKTGRKVVVMLQKLYQTSKHVLDNFWEKFQSDKIIGLHKHHYSYIRTVLIEYTYR